ncbi:MAG: molybdopterin-dependent oxidoreductase [Actinomycetota bacterium]
MSKMAGHRTNLALLIVLAWALATGALAFAIGQGWGRWIAVAHGAGGLAALLLAPWKAVIAKRGLRRRHAHRVASVALAVTVFLVLASGVGHATGLLRSVGGVTAMQIHVGSALAAVPLAIQHVLARRIRLRATDLSRRTMLRAVALTGGSALVYGGLEAVSGLAGLPGRTRRFTGSYRALSPDARGMPVTQWLNDSVPAIDAVEWRLATGPPGTSTVGVAELEAIREPVRAVLDCTGGWFADAAWEGVRLDRLLPSRDDGSGPARSIEVVSATGYSRRFPAGDAANLWLATRLAGAPLSPGHGSPARLVAPGRRGFWWVKWVASIRWSDTPWWWQPPFPLT